MNAIVTVRYLSGREEKFEVELWVASDSTARLEALLKAPTLLLQTEDEIILVPSAAIESISIALPEEGRRLTELSEIRRAKRVR